MEFKKLIYWTFIIVISMASLMLIGCAPDTKEEANAEVQKEIKKKAPSKPKTTTAPSNTYASAGELINHRNVDIVLLEQLIHEEINKVKRANGLPLLSKDRTLRNAATDQNNYQIRKGDLSHTQGNAGKQTLKDRISFYGGGFQATAENVIYEGFIIRTTGTQREIIAPTYREQAKKMVKSWMDSPGHRKNIMNPNYDQVGTAVGYHGELHAVFSTQVFGRKFSQ